jgi:bifunctional non-homologous end joining protein LigD
MSHNHADLTITHSNKIVYPEDKFTKQDVLNYYESVCDYILRYFHLVVA